MTRVLLLDISHGISAGAVPDVASDVALNAAPDITPDITQAITSNTTQNSSSEVTCRLISVSDLKAMANDASFKITQQFIDDFQRFGFTGVIAIIDSKIAGVLFLVSHIAVARHNSGGNEFSGIALDLPEGVSYLFKVFVKPEYRGRHGMAIMLRYASEKLRTAGITSIVSTTHWRNTDFLRSAERIGFTRCGFATEFVLASRHFYRLPKPFRSDGSTRGRGDDLHLSIRFQRPGPEYS